MAEKFEMIEDQSNLLLKTKLKNKSTKMRLLILLKKKSS
jgi:hypothetical protein